jgi:hypothetical protein
MTLRSFKERLENLVPSPPSWLFVYEGSPFDCRVFLIGANPARTTGRPFWKTYWTDEVGLNKAKLLGDLEALDGKLTRTRKKIEELRGLIGAPLLDANVHSRNTARQRDLTRNDAEEAPMLDSLIDLIHPDIVVAHGRRAFAFFGRMCPTLSEEKLCLQDAQRHGQHFKVLYCTHLSCIGGEEFEALISKVRQGLRAG